MRTLVFLTILSIIAPGAMAQTNKIYYDDTWQVSKKRDATYYRLYTALPDSQYKIEDHYADGQLYMTGYRTTILSNSCQYREGAIAFYDMEGHKTREGQYKNGLRVGTWKYYYDHSDAIRAEYTYNNDNGETEYISKSFDSLTHKLTFKSIYVDTNNTLTWNYHNNDSVLSEITRTHKGDTLITTTKSDNHIKICKERPGKGKKYSTTCYDEKGMEIADDTAAHNFVYVEEMPKAGFSMQKYLGDNLNYPKQARNNNIEGRIIIKFVVDEDGAIAHPQIVKGIGGGCDEEAMRVISEMPYWSPGYQNGRAVRVYFTLPISFKLH